MPSLSEAVALIVTLAGAVNVAPLAGELIDTVGGLFVPPLTVMLLAAEVVTAPPLSVALAVKL